LIGSLEAWQIALAVGVVAAGALLQGSVGFGFALIAAPVLALLEPRLVPGPVILMGLLLTLLMARRDWHAIAFGDLGWGLLGRIPGTLLAAWALTRLAPEALGLVFAGLVLLAVAISAVGPRVEPTTGALVGVSVLSGFMGTLSSIGGPPLALLYQYAQGARLRGTLSAHFVLSTLVSVTALHAVGRLGASEGRAALVLLPAVLLGYAVSGVTAPLLDRGHTRRAVLVVSALAALGVVVKQLT
jgi:uncharacterized membrane protein YfcA